MLWFMGLQRVGNDWATEPNWIERKEKQVQETVSNMELELASSLQQVNFTSYVSQDHR